MEETDIELPLRNDNQEDTDDNPVTDNPVDTHAGWKRVIVIALSCCSSNHEFQQKTNP